MKRIISLFALIIALGATSSSCICRNANAQSGKDRIVKEYDLRNFSELEIKGVFTVNISQGPYSVVLDVPADFEPYLNVVVKDGELEIFYKDTPARFRNMFDKNTYRSIANISLPDPEEISLSGSSDLVAADLKCVNLSIGCSGSSRIDLSGEFGHLDIDCSGASKGTISGTAKFFELDTSGACKINALDLKTNKAEVDVSGASSIKVCASERLSLDCAGASLVDYLVNDDTIVSVETSGASKVHRVE